MRILGLDVGTKTIGVAVSDEMGWTAQGIETIPRRPGEDKSGFSRLRELINHYDPETLVVGFPKNMDGSVGPRGEACREFAEEAEAAFSLPVVLWDERLTTMAAEKVLISADMSRKKRKKVVDKMAASLILQGYLDRSRSGK
ncbi:MAG TPA: Holliday junction resolvase RuvX [Bacillales bacterium]|nr:Holliday junction resolvase RuvX [Bacillales bacterium]